MTDRISEIRARCNAATPGPWMATWGLDARAMVLSHADKTFDVRLEGHSDAEFIAHSRDDIPYLLSLVLKLESGLNHANGKIEGMTEGIEILKAQLAEAERKAHDARNELCFICGKYREAHNGACDGCRWKKGAEQ